MLSFNTVNLEIRFLSDNYTLMQMEFSLTDKRDGLATLLDIEPKQELYERTRDYHVRLHKHPFNLDLPDGLGTPFKSSGKIIYVNAPPAEALACMRYTFMKCLSDDRKNMSVEKLRIIELQGKSLTHDIFFEAHLPSYGAAFFSAETDKDSGQGSFEDMKNIFALLADIYYTNIEVERPDDESSHDGLKYIRGCID